MSRLVGDTAFLLSDSALAVGNPNVEIYYKSNSCLASSLSPTYMHFTDQMILPSMDKRYGGLTDADEVSIILYVEISASEQFGKQALTVRFVPSIVYINQ
jgi:hypothetical protein